MISQIKGNQSSERNCSRTMSKYWGYFFSLSKSLLLKKKNPTLQNTYVTSLYVLTISGQCIYSDSKVKILFFTSFWHKIEKLRILRILSKVGLKKNFPMYFLFLSVHKTQTTLMLNTFWNVNFSVISVQTAKR